MEWVKDNPWAVWLAIAVLLAVVEMFSLDLVLLMFALGAGSGALVQGIGGPLWLAIAVFAVVSAALLLIARPPLVARLHDGPTLAQGHDAQIGRTATVIAPVDHHDGRIQLSGEIWSARTDQPATRFDIDDEVLVVRVDGATAVVTAVHTTTES